MATKLMTPGVYIEEKDAFPGSVVEVETAIPAFIGYTENASRNGKSLTNKPVRITSLAEYRLLFGGAFPARFSLASTTKVAKADTSKDAKKPSKDEEPAKEETPSETTESAGKHLITINGVEREIKFNTDHDAFMYKCVQLYYKNGGGTCYIVSVGKYDNNKVEVEKKVLLQGLTSVVGLSAWNTNGCVEPEEKQNTGYCPSDAVAEGAGSGSDIAQVGLEGGLS